MPPSHVGNAHSTTTKVTVCDVETSAISPSHPRGPSGPLNLRASKDGLFGCGAMDYLDDTLSAQFTLAAAVPDEPAGTYAQDDTVVSAGTQQTAVPA